MIEIRATAPACYDGGRPQLEETMRILASLTLGVVLAAGPAAAGEEDLYLDRGVAIQFPAKPQAMKSTYDSIFAKGLASMVYAAEADHVLYKLTVVDLTS